MNTKNSLTKFTLLAFAVLGIVSLAWAGNIQLPLMAAKAEPGASGTVVLSENGLTIQVKGLHPNSVYTVWFVNMKPKMSMAGAGQSPYMFKTDAEGNANYSASLTEPPFGKWQMVSIDRHPSGDPMNMKEMVDALSTKIPDKG